MLDRDKLAKILGLLSSPESGEILSAARAADALIRNANTSWAEVLNQSAAVDEVRALLAENERLWEIAQKLVVENDVLRKRADRRLTHRILDSAKQRGQALLALAIIFDGIAFLRRRLAALHRDSEPRPQRVVVHGLVAAGTALPMGIVAFLSLQDAAMLGGPPVRSGTMASSGQEAPEAAGRLGGPPAQAEKSAPSAAEKSPASVAEKSPSAVAEKSATMGPAPAPQSVQPTPLAVVAIDNPQSRPNHIQSQSPPNSLAVSPPVASAWPQSAESGDLQQANQTPPTVDNKELADPATREAIARGWALYYLPYTPARWQQARREFERAFEIDPRSGEARIGQPDTRKPLEPKQREAFFREFADYFGAPELGKAAAQEQALDPKERDALFSEFAEYQRTLELGTTKAGRDAKQREALFREFAEYAKTQE